MDRKKFYIVSGFLFLSFSSIKAGIEDFDEDLVKDAVFYARHAYAVADELFDPPLDDGKRIERRQDIRGQEVYPFTGRTGGVEAIGLGSHLHAVGGVYRRPDENRIYITFHGSKFLSDWLADFKFLKREALPLHGFDGEVHLGFSQVVESSYNSMARQIRAALGDTPAQDCEFIFSGHSLGAAVSTIAARQFSAQKGRHRDRENQEQDILPADFDKNKIKLLTISSPRVGDADFARTFHDDVPLVLRFHHQGDLVEKVPLESFGYAHVGREIPFLLGETLASKLSTMERWSDLNPVTPVSGVAVLGTKLISAAYAPYVAAGATVGVLMHIVPDEDVIMRAYYYERQYVDDPDYQGSSWFDLRRNAWLRKPFMFLLRLI